MNPDFNAPFPLLQPQCDRYRSEGHTLLRGVASKEEIQFIRPLITGIVDDVAAKKDPQGRISDYSRLFTQVTNVWRLNDAVRRFVFGRRFAGIAAALMGAPAVRLYHDQALVKEPGGNPTPWHQDYYYWPLDTEQTITMWMALVDIPASMGSMSFVTGSHRNGLFAEMPISDSSQAYFESMIEKNHMDVTSYDLKAGDATFHSGRMLHSAHANQSRQRREVVTVIYYADGARIMEPDNEHRRVDMTVFHPGQKPGEMAASELNPLLFP